LAEWFVLGLVLSSQEKSPELEFQLRHQVLSFPYHFFQGSGVRGQDFHRFGKQGVYAACWSYVNPDL